MFSGKTFSQLTNTGAYINVPAGIYLNAQCNILNDNFGINTGIIANDGNIITTGNISNNGNFLSGNLSSVKLEGAIQNLNGLQPYTFNDLIIDGTGNKNLNIGIKVRNNLLFNANKVLINNFNIVLMPLATISNSSYQKYVVTNGNGSLVKKEIALGTDFLFPVGDALNSFKPVILNAGGVLDTFAVRVINGVYPADQTTVQKTYIIKESTPLASTASITLGWNTVDQGTAFQPSQTLMWQKLSSLWTSINTTPAGAYANSPSTDWKYMATGVQFQSLTADSFILKSAAPPVIHGQPQNLIVCEYGSGTFSVSATGLGVLSFQWQINCSGSWANISNGGTSPVYSGANDSILHLSNIPFSQNGCSFRCVVSNIAGATNSNAAVLNVHQAPSAIISGDTTICEGDSTVLTVQTSGNNYLWSTLETTHSITVNPIATQSYSVTVTDVNTCTNSASIVVQVTADFSVSLTSDFAPTNQFLQGQIITITAAPPGYDNYAFFVSGKPVQSSASNLLNISTLMNGDLITVIASVNECTATDSLAVIVKPIANAFTPFDRDNVNDVFAKGVDLVIFNRWGQVLYTGTKGWDGTYNGNQVSYGTYFYIITLNEDKGQPQTLTGVVTVISKNK